MSVMDIISLVKIKDSVTVGGFVFVIMATLLQISKININPWDKFFGWIGDRINKKVNTRLDEMNLKVDGVSDKLDRHIAESELKDVQDTRRDILDFANSCMNGRKHTKEQFDFVIKECDDYEIYIESKNIKNGVVTSAIKEIRRLYDKCVQTNSFLKEEEYN